MGKSKVFTTFWVSFILLTVNRVLATTNYITIYGIAKVLDFLAHPFLGAVLFLLLLFTLGEVFSVIINNDKKITQLEERINKIYEERE